MEWSPLNVEWPAIIIAAIAGWLYVTVRRALQKRAARRRRRR